MTSKVKILRSQLTNELAMLIIGRDLKALYRICENQGTVDTDKLRTELELIENRLKERASRIKDAHEELLRMAQRWEKEESGGCRMNDIPFMAKPDPDALTDSEIDIAIKDEAGNIVGKTKVKLLAD